MRLSNTNKDHENADAETRFRYIRLASCQKFLAPVARVKEAIFTESFKALKTQQHLLRLVLNEAEAVAWQTRYPHLVFPALALEKIQAVVAWDAHQQSVRRTNPVFRLGS